VKLDPITPRNKYQVVLRRRGFKWATSIAVGKKLLQPPEINPTAEAGIHIINLASVVSICPCARNTTTAGEEPLRKIVEDVTRDLLLDLALTHGRVEAEKVITAVRSVAFAFFPRTCFCIASGWLRWEQEVLSEGHPSSSLCSAS
jgi:hypothetical protein